MVNVTGQARAPAHLSKHSKAIFRSIVADYRLGDEPAALRVLTLALEASDRAEQARLALAEHGLTYTDRFGQPHSRPEIAIERDSRLATARLFRELSLDSEFEDARVPRVNGARG